MDTDLPPAWLNQLHEDITKRNTDVSVEGYTPLPRAAPRAGKALLPEGWKSESTAADYWSLFFVRFSCSALCL